MKVLITTSGVGSRLGELTKYTNKSLIRVGKKPSISYIIETYPKDSEFVITLGYYGDHVQEFLTIAYPDYKFTFVHVNPYEGEGSSLGFSMLRAKEHLQEPFIFHACDTIITQKITSIDSNWLGGGRKGSSSQYRTFSVMGNKVRHIHEKGELKYDYEYLGICAIKDYKEFWENLRDVYLSNPKNNSLSDCDALKLCIKQKDFTYKHFEWHDIGNLDSLTEARKSISDEFDLLDKVDESIFIFEDSVIKFFYDKKTCKNRIERANILKGKVPEIISSGNNFYKYKFAQGELFSRVANIINFNHLLEWSKDNLWNRCGNVSPEFYEICKDFYFNKTMKRLEKFHKDNNLEDIPHIINGVKVPTIKEMFSKINQKWLCYVDPYHFHGDFILDNMLIDGDKITLLDWRQDFGGHLEWGDMYYDLGKLNHNLIINHDIVHKEQFSVEYDNDKITVDIMRKQHLVDCQEVLNNFAKYYDYDLKKIKILSSIIWLNMSPLHDKKFGLFLYYFGKYNLWKEISC